MGQNQQHQAAEEEELEPDIIQGLYRSFLMECPSGSLHLHEFKKMFGVHSGTPEAQYMDCIFRAFDMNHDNTMDFIEYVAAVNLVLRGRLEDKLRWSFKVFDSDNNGRLDKKELYKIVKIIYKIKQGSMTEDADMQGLTASQVCERIFQEVDVNSDGQITLEEFVEGAQKSNFLRNFLQLDIHPCSWVNKYLSDRKISGPEGS